MAIPADFLEEDLERYRLHLNGHLASRPFTECFLGSHLDTGTRVFVKMLRSEDPRIQRNFLREIEVLRMLQGQPGFPDLTAFRDNAVPYFHACGYLSSPMFETFAPACGDRTIESITRSTCALASWIADFHARGYVHRDLSPDHVFITHDFRPTVVDFGMARRTNGLAPDRVVLYEGYDIQAFGMMLWELLCGRPVFAYRGADLAEQVGRELELIESVRSGANECALTTNALDVAAKALSVRSEFNPKGIRRYKPYASAQELYLSCLSTIRVG